MISFKLVACLACVLVAALQAHAGCPSGFTDAKGKCYSVHKEKKTWIKAQEDCVDKGGFLASVWSDENMKALQELKPTFDSTCEWYWAGGIRCKTNYAFFQTKVSPGYSPESCTVTSFEPYTNWAHTQPDNYGPDGESCLELRPNFQWNDLLCATPSCYICQTIATS